MAADELCDLERRQQAVRQFAERRRRQLLAVPLAGQDYASIQSLSGASYKPPKHFRPGTNGCDADLASAFGGPRGTEVDSPGGAWAKPEAMLVVFERSALVRGERGVPVFRPGLPLAYHYALSAGGHFMGFNVLGEFFLRNRGRDRTEIVANAVRHFEEFAHMVRPIESGGEDLKGTAQDGLLSICTRGSELRWPF